MSISYDKFWNLVRRNRMKIGELSRAAQLSQHTLKQLKYDKPVNLRIMIRICKIFHCDIGDLMEVIEDDLQTVPKTNS